MAASDTLLCVNNLVSQHWSCKKFQRKLNKNNFFGVFQYFIFTILVLDLKKLSLSFACFCAHKNIFLVWSLKVIKKKTHWQRNLFLFRNKVCWDLFIHRFTKIQKTFQLKIDHTKCTKRFGKNALDSSKTSKL